MAGNPFHKKKGKEGGRFTSQTGQTGSGGTIDQAAEKFGKAEKKRANLRAKVQGTVARMVAKQDANKGNTSLERRNNARRAMGIGEEKEARRLQREDENSGKGVAGGAEGKSDPYAAARKGAGLPESQSEDITMVTKEVKNRLKEFNKENGPQGGNWRERNNINQSLLALKRTGTDAPELSARSRLAHAYDNIDYPFLTKAGVDKSLADHERRQAAKAAKEERAKELKAYNDRWEDPNRIEGMKARDKERRQAAEKLHIGRWTEVGAHGGNKSLVHPDKPGETLIVSQGGKEWFHYNEQGLLKSGKGVNPMLEYVGKLKKVEGAGILATANKLSAGEVTSGINKTGGYYMGGPKGDKKTHITYGEGKYTVHHAPDDLQKFNSMKDLQRRLGLKNADITVNKKPVLSSKELYGEDQGKLTDQQVKDHFAGSGVRDQQWSPERLAKARAQLEKNEAVNANNLKAEKTQMLIGKVVAMPAFKDRKATAFKRWQKKKK